MLLVVEMLRNLELDNFRIFKNKDKMMFKLIKINIKDQND